MSLCGRRLDQRVRGRLRRLAAAHLRRSGRLPAGGRRQAAGRRYDKGMLALTSAKMDTLEDGRLAAFLARAQAHARSHFPDIAEDLGEAGVDRLARLAIGRANLYEMGGERHVLQVLTLMLLLGPQFDVALPQSAQVQQVMSDTAVDADARLDLAFELLAPAWGGAAPARA